LAPLEPISQVLEPVKQTTRKHAVVLEPLAVVEVAPATASVKVPVPAQAAQPDEGPDIPGANAQEPDPVPVLAPHLRKRRPKQDRH
jgi:hypothetical protein